MIMEILEGLNWGLIAPLIIIQLILLIVSLVDLGRIEKTNGPKWLWVLIILFVNIIGPILYFVFGRRND
jgi:Phospholipase_D-nuclease N-terminal